MFAAKKHETVLEAQTRALNVPWYRFLQRVKCGHEMSWNHPKHEFYTEIVDWACSLRQNKKWFWWHKLMHLMHPILIFTVGQVWHRNGMKPPETRVLDIMYVVRNQTDVLEHRNCVKIPKMWVLDLQECIEIFQVVCLESYCSETFNQMHADSSFRNESGASTKCHETTKNMSFGPKVVDWACSLLENKKQFRRHKLVQ